MEPKANHEATLAFDPLRRGPRHDNSVALEEVFSRCRSQLYKTALRLLGDPEDAEDALQEGLLAAFRKLNTFEGRSKLSTWLTRIVFNAALMHLRRRRPQLLVSMDEPLSQDQDTLAQRIPDQRPNPEEIYERQELLQVVARYFGSLPAPYQQALWLRHVEGLKIREAAEASGLSTGTIKTRLSRAKLRLMKQVADAGLRRGALPDGWAEGS